MRWKIFTAQELEQLALKADFRPIKMASLLGISLRQLERIFADTLAISPKECARRIRCRIAKEMIAEGYSNKEVAAKLKFSSAAHLCQEFRKWFGNTPRSFAPTYFNGDTRENLVKLLVS